MEECTQTSRKMKYTSSLSDIFMGNRVVITTQLPKSKISIFIPIRPVILLCYIPQANTHHAPVHQTSCQLQLPVWKNAVKCREKWNPQLSRSEILT
ncbi:hypothetical protein H5410_028620, partial [Solanum commersonii]